MRTRSAVRRDALLARRPSCEPHRRRCPRRPVRAGALLGVLALVAAWTLCALPAAADPIAGATYSGVATDGADVGFTLSADGTLVTSYRITGVKANTCQFIAEGDNGVWRGAAIVAGAFTYTLDGAILFQGTFPGAQSASGTFRLYDGATSATAACDTGIVSWTATTTATPPPGTGGSGPSGGGSGATSGGGTGGSQGKHAIATRVSFRELSRKRIGGRIRSSSATCRAARTVILWRGSRRIGSTKSKANGSFWFRRTARTHGRVRASTPARTVHGVVCDAGSSTFIKA
jgi:hypothetical protein